MNLRQKKISRLARHIIVLFLARDLKIDDYSLNFFNKEQDK